MTKQACALARREPSAAGQEILRVGGSRLAPTQPALPVLTVLPRGRCCHRAHPHAHRLARSCHLAHPALNLHRPAYLIPQAIAGPARIPPHLLLLARQSTRRRRSAESESLRGAECNRSFVGGGFDGWTHARGS